MLGRGAQGPNMLEEANKVSFHHCPSAALKADWRPVSIRTAATNGATLALLRTEQEATNGAFRASLLVTRTLRSGLLVTKWSRLDDESDASTASDFWATERARAFNMVL